MPSAGFSRLMRASMGSTVREGLRSSAPSTSLHSSGRSSPRSYISIVVQRTVVQDDMCAAFCRVTAVHAGDTFGAPATGEMVDFTGISIARVRDGRIVEVWNCFDFLSMYQQIGWVRSPPLP